MSKNTVYIADANSVKTYLSGPKTATPYAGSGTPWTVESTSPYQLADNDVTGNSYVPQPAPHITVFGGGPPFALGAKPIYRGYDRLVEPVGVQIRATSKDNAIALLRRLHQIINASIAFTPSILAVTGGTNTTYFDLYAADVSEHVDYIHEKPDGYWRATITWVRSPFGGLLSTPETVINGATFTNTGSLDGNTSLYSAGSGDLIYDGGQPLNLKFTPANVASQNITRLFAASIYQREYSTTGSGSKTTSSTSFSTATLMVTDISAVINRPGLRVRFLLRGTQTANSEIYLTAAAVSGDTVFTSKTFRTGLNGTIIDCGFLIPSRFRQSQSLSGASLTLTLHYRSTDGASATYGHTYAEVLKYWTFCRIDPTAGLLPANASTYLLIDAFKENTDIACLPHQSSRALIVGSGAVLHEAPMRGQAPRYVADPFGSVNGLWLAWLENSFLHTASRTATVYATHAPLYRTLRGAT